MTPASQDSRLLSDAEIEAVTKRADAATRGPWQTFYPTDSGLLPDVLDAKLNPIACAWGNDTMQPGEARANGEFIAAARSDISRLLEHIAALDDIIDGATKFTIALSEKVEAAIAASDHIAALTEKTNAP